MIDKRMLEEMNEEDLCSHLYMAEAYYFNAKQIKRQQVRLLSTIPPKLHMICYR